VALLGCGAAGGAYDAALACGRPPREAIELMIAHGLTTRRAGPPERAGVSRNPPRPAAAPRNERSAHYGRGTPSSHELAMGEQELAAAHQRLARLAWPPRVLRGEQARVWSHATLLELEYGWERGRVTIPIRDGHGGPRGGPRYAPSHDHAPKVPAVPGTRLGLIPHPGAESSTWVVLVEGPPDMISARSRGLPAIAVPAMTPGRPGVGAAVRSTARVGGAGRDQAGRGAPRGSRAT
jgi:hypothetical protein